MQSGRDGFDRLSAGRPRGFDALDVGDSSRRICWKTICSGEGAPLAARVLVCKIGPRNHGL